MVWFPDQLLYGTLQSDKILVFIGVALHNLFVKYKYLWQCDDGSRSIVILVLRLDQEALITKILIVLLKMLHFKLVNLDQNSLILV